MIVHDEAYYRSRMPVKDLGTMGNFLRFVWDKDRKAFLDRTARDWALVGLFYLCFFGVLFSLFAFQMWIAFAFMGNLDKPYMQHSSKILRSSVLGSNMRSFMQTTFIAFDNPGLGFTPNILTPMSSPIIWVSDTHLRANPDRYVSAITNFIDEYKINDTDLYDMNCDPGRYRGPFSWKCCYFDTSLLGPCSTPPYGYTKPYTPCVLLKFNKRFDWIPIFYNQTSDLPEKMPYGLRTIIRLSQKAQVWLSCTGATNVDKEHIGEIEYYPSPGFPVEFFPFHGQPEYVSPVVGIMFKNLTVGRLITVECSVWAQNIGQDRDYCLDFQIMVGL